MTIDAHHHFWRYDPVAYDWIDDAMGAIRRDFLPADLAAEIDAAGVDGVVSVQARQSVEETRWLLELAGEHDFIRGVVGWLSLVQPGLRDELAKFAADAKLKAVRHVLQGEPDDYMGQRAFDAGIDALDEFGLAYDILIVERQLPAAIALVDRHPRTVFVLDHVAKPRIRDGVLAGWRENIAALGRRPNVYCKLSGMVTEADPGGWTVEQLRPYADIVLEAFGPRRVMFGSDWPVCLVACEYARWRQIAGEFIAALSADGQARVLGGTAVEAYKLSRTQP